MFHTVIKPVVESHAGVFAAIGQFGSIFEGLSQGRLIGCKTVHLSV